MGGFWHGCFEMCFNFAASDGMFFYKIDKVEPTSRQASRGERGEEDWDSVALQDPGRVAGQHFLFYYLYICGRENKEEGILFALDYSTLFST